MIIWLRLLIWLILAVQLTIGRSADRIHQDLAG
jgi:hypothetical protein